MVTIYDIFLLCLLAFPYGVFLLRCLRGNQGRPGALELAGILLVMAGSLVYTALMMRHSNFY